MKKLFSFLLLGSLLFSCSENRTQISSTATQTSVKQVESKDTPIIVPTLKNISFANTSYNLEDLDVKERFEREMIVNSYWHSNTIFYLKRANRWFPLIESILKEEGIPNDFKYLAVIESGLKQATSPAGAKGFWQFIKGTGKDYQLEIDKDVDERLHVEKSTRAACKYLRNAYDKFNSWALAAAAYNRGKAGIERDLTKQHVNHIFDLNLNSETARYFFRILAVKEILSNPTKYHFSLTEDQKYQPYKTIDKFVTEDIDDLSLWAVQQGFNLKIIKRLNPWLISNQLKVKKGNSYVILLPAKSEKLSPYKGN